MNYEHNFRHLAWVQKAKWKTGGERKEEDRGMGGKRNKKLFWSSHHMAYRLILARVKSIKNQHLFLRHLFVYRLVRCHGLWMIRVTLEVNDVLFFFFFLPLDQMINETPFNKLYQSTASHRCVAFLKKKKLMKMVFSGFLDD